MFGMSKRETVLVLALLLGVIGYLVYTFVYVPKSDEMSELKTELETIKQERIIAEGKISTIPFLEQSLLAELELASEGVPLYFDSVVQENLIIFLVELEQKSSLGATSYSFSSPVVSTFNSMGIEKSVLERYPLIVYKTGVNISFSCTYDEVMGYLKLLEDYEKEIIVAGINLSGSDGFNLTGTLELEFYELQKRLPNESDLKFHEWKFDIPKGKDNPFGREGNVLDIINQIQNELEAIKTENERQNNSQGQNQGSEVQGQATQGDSQTAFAITYTEPDFFMIARSFTSGLPTMTLGYSPDLMAETYVRSTRLGIEDVTVELTEENGKYYYRFLTASRLFPALGVMEFVPVNKDIRFIIYSDRRVGDSDVNQINLTIINKTGLELNWTVTGEDTDRPRVNVSVQ